MRARKRYSLAAAIVLACGFAVLSFLFMSTWAKKPPVRFDPLEALDVSSSISVTVVVTEKPQPVLPDAFSLSQNYPNPFNQGTVIKYALPEDCYVKLTIYNILGQKVKTLVDRYQTAGYKQVYWDGRDDKGNEIASGSYLYRINAGGYIGVKKMVVIK